MPSHTFVCQILLSVILAKPSLGEGCRFITVKEDYLRFAFGIQLFSNTVKNSETTSRELQKLYKDPWSKKLMQYLFKFSSKNLFLQRLVFRWLSTTDNVTKNCDFVHPFPLCGNGHSENIFMLRKHCLS